MKKFFATLLMGAAVLTGSAQTEFRHISFDAVSYTHLTLPTTP